MSLFIQLVVGSAMIGMTALLHALSLDLIIRATPKTEKFLKKNVHLFWQPLVSVFVVMGVFVGHVTHIWLWAFLYTFLEYSPLEGFSDALYFATVAYTTLGFGDITLDPSYRMLSGITAANGFILFGWTTAFIFEVISQLYKKEAKTF